jgi:hypothetical protein
MVTKLVLSYMAIGKVISAKALTLYTTPGTAMLLKGFQEELVLVLRPFLPLLGYRVRLACLNGKCQKCDLGERKNISNFIRFAILELCKVARAKRVSSCRARTLGALAPSGKSIAPEFRAFFRWSMQFPWPARSAAGLWSLVALISFRSRKEFGGFSSQHKRSTTPLYFGEHMPGTGHTPKNMVCSKLPPKRR